MPNASACVGGSAYALVYGGTIHGSSNIEVRAKITRVSDNSYIGSHMLPFVGAQSLPSLAYSREGEGLARRHFGSHFGEVGVSVVVGLLKAELMVLPSDMYQDIVSKDPGNRSAGGASE